MTAGSEGLAPAAWERRRSRHTVAVVGLAFGLRLLVILFALQHFGAAWFFHRGTEVGFVAHALLQGDGFSSPFGPATGPTALIAPGYPVFVAGVFAVLGEFSTASAALLMGVNALADTATVWLVLYLARKLASERAALLAALIPACSVPLWWMPSIFWETSFSALLLLTAIALTVKLRSSNYFRWWWLGGGFFAFCGLVNPALLPTLGVLGLYAACVDRQTLWRPLTALAAFVLVFSPWPLRNALVFHAFVPMRTTVGFELWMGNRDGASGYLDESVLATFNRVELGRYRALGEVKYMAEKNSLAGRWILHHPVSFARLTTLRIIRFWFGMGTRAGSMAYAAHALLTTCLGLVGLYGLGRGREVRLVRCLAIALVCFPLPYYLTHAEFRYRLVLDPVLCVLGAGAFDRELLTGWARRLSGLRRSPAAEPTLWAGCLWHG